MTLPSNSRFLCHACGEHVCHLGSRLCLYCKVKAASAVFLGLCTLAAIAYLWNVS